MPPREIKMTSEFFLNTIQIRNKTFYYWDIQKLGVDILRLPYSIRILVENLMRHLHTPFVDLEDVQKIATWQKTYAIPMEIGFHPARVLMQDLTGVAAVVDLASMRSAVAKMGKDPKVINPLVPVDLVVDHSVQTDYYGTSDAHIKNVQKEYERNSERYRLLKWAQQNFSNFRVVPPNSGICHQINLEFLADVVSIKEMDFGSLLFCDSVVGTDSHTTTINGLGVMGWGVGGIEAEAVMLGQPYYMSIPEVIGVELTGTLNMGVTSTDIALALTERLRTEKVVEKFVEYFGSGVKALNLTDRATIANMSPEYGATMGFFPIDEKTIVYLQNTGREEVAERVEAYAYANQLFYEDNGKTPEYTRVIKFDLNNVLPAIAGPSRPQDRILLSDSKKKIEKFLSIQTPDRRIILSTGEELTDGSVVIASITSCTNTSNPSLLIAAGLLAKKAVERGLQVPTYVKTSLAPGSTVTSAYLASAGLLESLEKLGFYVVGFGCMTCIGNSGPLNLEIENIIKENRLVVSSILSGNRNFEARIHALVKTNFLASPLLVVAFALAGRMTIDFEKEPIGTDKNGKAVYLKEIWPTDNEIHDLIKAHVAPIFYKNAYQDVFSGDTIWQSIEVAESPIFPWDESSTYIKNPPYFEDFSLEVPALKDINTAKVLLALGSSVTTDHISPAGSIPKEYPAGQYLLSNGIMKEEFNSYGSRRGNHEIMMRGTFSNVRIKNALVAPKEGGYTLKLPEGEEMFVFDASVLYESEKTSLIILAGNEYGTGSSRDWAAKGTQLLGVRAVIAQSFERIHRSNLIGMGVLPLVFIDGQSRESLKLTGSETFSIETILPLTPQKQLRITAIRKDGTIIEFNTIARLDTDVEIAYFTNGGILPYVLRSLLKTKMQ